MEQLIYYWGTVIAPGDMTFYTGNLFPWKGDLIVAALGTAQLVRLDIEGDRVIGEERLISYQGRIRDVTQAPDDAPVRPGRRWRDSPAGDAAKPISEGETPPVRSSDT